MGGYPACVPGLSDTRPAPYYLRHSSRLKKREERKGIADPGSAASTGKWLRLSRPCRTCWAVPGTATRLQTACSCEGLATISTSLQWVCSWEAGNKKTPTWLGVQLGVGAEDQATSSAMGSTEDDSKGAKSSRIENRPPNLPTHPLQVHTVHATVPILFATAAVRVRRMAGSQA